MADLFGDQLMADLFGDDLLPAELAGRITEAYRQKLLLNPPTPSFSTRTNPGTAEAFARRIAPKDITRLFAVLAEMGLEIVERKSGERLPDAPGHGDS